MQKNCKIRINLKGDFEQELSESEKKAARVKPALTNLDFDKFVCKLKENRWKQNQEIMCTLDIADYHNTDELNPKYIRLINIEPHAKRV